MSNEAEKESAGRASVKFVRDGDIVGLGTGSTAAFAVHFLAERVWAGLKIRAIPTSRQTQQLAASLGIPLTTLDEFQEIDITIDGADEIDPQLRLIKGGGGAFLREKIIASASRKLVIIADSTKLVSALGKAPVPVEVIPFAQALVAKKLTALGAVAKIRLDESGKPGVTDEGHHILDCYFNRIDDPAALARRLEGTPGVVEHGLFIDMADVVLIGRDGGVQELRRVPTDQ
jgi:ribose 5-phosphate isomerase A